MTNPRLMESNLTACFRATVKSQLSEINNFFSVSPFYAVSEMALTSFGCGSVDEKDLIPPPLGLPRNS
jgi:hypothetical protein